MVLQVGDCDGMGAAVVRQFELKEPHVQGICFAFY